MDKITHFLLAINYSKTAINYIHLKTGLAVPPRFRWRDHKYYRCIANRSRRHWGFSYNPSHLKQGWGIGDITRCARVAPTKSSNSLWEYRGRIPHSNWHVRNCCYRSQKHLHGVAHIHGASGESIHCSSVVDSSTRFWTGEYKECLVKSSTCRRHSNSEAQLWPHTQRWGKVMVSIEINKCNIYIYTLLTDFVVDRAKHVKYECAATGFRTW